MSVEFQKRHVVLCCVFRKELSVTFVAADAIKWAAIANLRREKVSF